MIDATCKCPAGTVTRPEKPIGHHGTLHAGHVTCSWCHAQTQTPAAPPFTIKCRGCRRQVRVAE